MEELDFEAWFENANFTKNGDLKLIIVVPRRDKAKAIPLTDATGRRFMVHISALQRPAIDAPSVPVTVSQLPRQTRPANG